MKTTNIQKGLLTLFAAFVSLWANAQSKTSADLEGGPQAVVSTAVKNPDVLIVTGKIIDAASKKPITNARINFDKFGEELLQASIDDKGNYALALNKKELGEPMRLIFKVAGYKRFIFKNISKQETYVEADIILSPVEEVEKSNVQVKYKMNDDPFNPLVIKMQ